MYKYLKDIKKFIKTRLKLAPNIEVKSLSGYSGFFNMDTNTIIVDKNLSDEKFIMTVLHEAMHAFCVKKGKYKIYHKTFDYLETKREVSIFLNTALNAELYVEEAARKLARDFEPDFEYRDHFGIKLFLEDLEQYKRLAKEKGLL